MDRSDAPGTPEWRPLSRLSNNGAVSNAGSGEPSSLYLSPARDLASMTSSDHGSVSASSEDALATASRDLSPWETDACRILTEKIRSSSSSAKDFASSPHSGVPPAAVDVSLREAALAIQYNAKWFAQDQLSVLLDAALTAVTASNSSSELYAAVKLIDTISTYSYIPQSCIVAVVCFIAQAYHGSTRAVKTKRLAQAASETFDRILASHLGTQCVAALLHILGSADEASLETHAGYAQIAGALRLIMDHLESDSSSLPTASIADVVTSLRSVSACGTENLCEDVLNAMSRILEDDEYTRALDNAIVWDVVLDVVTTSVNRCPKGPEAQHTIELILRHLSHFEARHHRLLASLAASSTSPVPLQLAEAAASIADLLPPSDGPAELSELAEKLRLASRSTEGLQVLTRLVQIKLPAILDLSSRQQVSELAAAYNSISEDPKTSPDAIKVLSSSAIRLLDQSIGIDREALSTLFNLCARLSLRSVTAAEALLRTRVDTDMAVYIEGLHRSRPFAESSDFAPLDSWVHAIPSALQSPANWDIYHCFSSRLPELLSNHTLFESRIPVINSLRTIICQQLRSGGYPEPPASTGMTKSHVARDLVRALMTIIGYHRFFSKQELVQTLSVFLDTSGMRDYTVSIQCIHALGLCCYEIPLIMTSYMDDVIDKMAKMVTQKMLAIHVLQFLAGLSRTPDLYRNFKEHDYKKIFGVCGNYLRSMRVSEVLGPRQIQHEERGQESVAASDDALPQYIYALAHHVISFWYMGIRASERKDIKSYITSCLKYEGADGRETIEDQGVVTIDVMDAMDALELSESVNPTELQLYDTEGKTTILHRMAGTMLISTETALRTGRTVVDIRRPSGHCQKLIVSQPGQAPVCPSVTMESTAKDFVLVVPEPKDMLTYGRIFIPSPSSALGSAQVLTLEPSPELDRAMQFLDRVSGLDSYKAGIVYVGEGQTDETEILQNSSGSPDFWDLINQLGEPRRLKGATFNTHGLDRENDMDGTNTVVWENAVTQLVFHVTVLMPKQSEIIHKKKHIGNDAVNIIFNNSGLPFRFDTLPTQATHAYIVISPADRTSFLQARRSSSSTTASGAPFTTRDSFYKVHMVTRPGYPTVSPACTEKVVNGHSLPAFVRNLVLNECIFAIMWEHRHEAPGDFPSSWRARLRQLRIIRERHGRARNETL